MGKWKRVLLSGSNFHVNALTASLSDIGSISFGSIPENRRKIVTTRFQSGDDSNPDQNKFFSTGSYGGAGAPPTNIDWFPANTNVVLGAANTSIGNTGRAIRLRALNPVDAGSFPANGNAAINFYTSGSTVGLNDNTDYTLQILRGSGFTSNTAITHKGEENFKIQLSESFDVVETSFTRPNASFQLPPSPPFPYVPSNIGATQFSNLANLYTSNTGDSTVTGTDGIYGNNPEVCGFQGHWTFPSIDLDDEIVGMELKYSAKSTPSTAFAGWFFNNSYSNVTTNLSVIDTGDWNDVVTSALTQLKTNFYNPPSTSLTTYTLGGPNDNWALTNGSTALGSPKFRNLTSGILLNTVLVSCCFLMVFASSTSTLTLNGNNTGDGSPALKIYSRRPQSNYIVSFFDENEADLTSNNLTVRSDGIVFKPRLTAQSSGISIIYAQQGSLAKNDPGVGVSSRRVKKNIKDLDPKIIENFDKLRPVSFNYYSSPNKTDLGFIAEELAKVNPILAQFGPDYTLTPDKKINHLAPLLSDKKVPTNINFRAILALSVAKLKQLEKELNNI